MVDKRFLNFPFQRTSRFPFGWIFGPILFLLGRSSSYGGWTSNWTCYHTLMTLMMSAPLALSEYWPFETLQTLSETTIPYLQVVFGVNDVFDYQSDRVNKRKTHAKGIEGGVLKTQYHSICIYGSLLLSVAIMCIPLIALDPAQQRKVSSAATVLLIGCSWAYSAPPFCLKSRPFLDSLSNGTLCWLAWYLGIFSIDTNPSGDSLAPRSQDHQGVMRQGWTIFLGSSLAHILGAIGDIESDLAVGDCTIATTLGVRKAVAVACIS